MDALDIGEIEQACEDELRSYRPYHPRMMLKILIYGYSTGVHSSRKLAKKCEDEVAFRYLLGNNLPKLAFSRLFSDHFTRTNS
ncbi:MAG: transposase [Patescibacteria group bacterium]